MASRVQHSQFRAELDDAKYPFADSATLTNGAKSLLEGTLIDACLYPVGGGPSMYLSKVVITHDTVTLYVGDLSNDSLASGSFDVIDPPDEIKLVDTYSRPAGILVSTGVRLGLFQTWGTGTHTFTEEQTPFVASVTVPTPEVGLRGFLLADGSVMTGDVWIVGDDGVVVRYEETAGVNGAIPTIRVDFVGDPLFRRRLCGSNDLFVTPKFVKTITFTDGHQEVVVTPDSHGDVQMTVNNAMAENTVLRLRSTSQGLIIECVGSELEDVN